MVKIQYKFFMKYLIQRKQGTEEENIGKLFIRIIKPNLIQHDLVYSVHTFFRKLSCLTVIQIVKFHYIQFIYKDLLEQAHRSQILVQLIFEMELCSSLGLCQPENPVSTFFFIFYTLRLIVELDVQMECKENLFDKSK